MILTTTAGVAYAVDILARTVTPVLTGIALRFVDAKPIPPLGVQFLDEAGSVLLEFEIGYIDPATKVSMPELHSYLVRGFWKLDLKAIYQDKDNK